MPYSPPKIFLHPHYSLVIQYQSAQEMLLLVIYSGVARGGNGGGLPQVALFGGSKIEVIPKNKQVLELRAPFLSQQ